MNTTTYGFLSNLTAKKEHTKSNCALTLPPREVLLINENILYIFFV